MKRTRKPRQRRRPKLVKQNLQDFGLVDFGGVVCRPDCPAWWRESGGDDAGDTGWGSPDAAETLAEEKQLTLLDKTESRE